MSEPHELPDASTATKAPGETGAADSKAPIAWRHRWIAIGLAVGLVLVLGSVVSAPFWAPLLPWAPVTAPVATARDTAAAAQPQTQPAQVEPPQTPSAQGQPQSQPPPQRQPDETAATPALQLLVRRVGALEARPAAPASDIAEIRRQLARLASSVADLDTRVAAIGTAAPAPVAADMTDMALVLALLQIRGAIEVGRPFAAEYEALTALAAARPEIAAAAAPLAEPANTGLATRAVLATRLRELGGVSAPAKIAGDAGAKGPADASADAGETAPDWSDRALTRLRGLVTIRRIDAADERQTGDSPKPPVPKARVPETPVNAAELALAGGDLEGAVGVLDKLAGAPAEAARPWLRMAKQRLAVETALHRIEALLVARLGTTRSAPTGSGSPR